MKGANSMELVISQVCDACDIYYIYLFIHISLKHVKK